jgi:hypothetical protein
MPPFILRMVKIRVTGIQFQVAAPFLICHDDQMVHKADTALYIMDAGDSCPLSKLAKAFTCNREVLPHTHTHTHTHTYTHTHYRLSWHGDNNQTYESHTVKNSAVTLFTLVLRYY